VARWRTRRWHLLGRHGRDKINPSASWSDGAIGGDKPRDNRSGVVSVEIIIPDWLEVNDWERSVLQIIRERLKEGVNEGTEWNQPESRESERTEVESDEEKADPPAPWS